MGGGVLVRQDQRQLTGWIGTSALVVPYRLESHFGNTTPVGDWGLTAPGFSIFTGSGWRTQNGELQGQLAYVFVALDGQQGGWQGAVGGVVGTIGYKLLY